VRHIATVHALDPYCWLARWEGDLPGLLESLTPVLGTHARAPGGSAILVLLRCKRRS
jgi:hypothetical protein